MIVRSGRSVRAISIVKNIGVLLVLCVGLAACSEEGGQTAEQDVDLVERDAGDQDTGKLDADEGIVDDISIETLPVQDISANGATFYGSVKGLSGEGAEDHGFCFSHADDAEVCSSLGALTEPGDFSLAADGLLPGRNYDVRAYAVVGAKTFDGARVEFTTPAVEVTGFAASAGEFAEHVRLSWEMIEGAETYVLYRDGLEIAQVDGAQNEYVDEGASAGEGLSEVTGLTASQGDFADHVLVKWEPVVSAPGASHSYQMLAKYPDLESGKTAGIDGYRKGFEVKSYEVSRDGAAFVEVGAQAEYQDFEATAGEIIAAQASASNGTHLQHVVLNVVGEHSVKTSDTTYVVRAVSEVDGQPVIGPESAEVRGFRGVGEVKLQWEHSSNDINYTSISGATTKTYHHTGAYEDGTPRFYRVRFSAPGAENVYSDVVSGSRAFLSVRFVEIPSEADINQPFGTEIEVTNQFNAPFGGVEVRMMLARDTVPFFAKSFGSQTTDALGRAIYMEPAPVPWPGMDFLFEAKLPNNKMFYSEQFRVDRAALVVGSSTQGLVVGNGQSVEPALSGDGRYMVFASMSENLVAGHPAGSLQIYRKDLMEGTVKRVSASRNGTPGAGDSSDASVSADGRFVAFVSTATNLLASPLEGDTAQVFVKNMDNGDVFLISATKGNVVGDQDSSRPAISADGRFVVFVSNATNLVSGIVDEQINHVYRKDLQSGELEIVTRVSGQPAADESSFNPAISADGSKVVFSSEARNLVAGLPAGPGIAQVFLRDMNAGGGFTLVSRNEDGDPADGTSRNASISGDGRYVTFGSMAMNFAQNTNALWHDHVYRKDLVSGAIVYVSTNASGEIANQNSLKPVMSADGRYVVFVSNASNLLAGAEGLQIYRKDLESGDVVLVSANLNQEVANNYSEATTISANGRYIGFSSMATNLMPGVGGVQVYVRRR